MITCLLEGIPISEPELIEFGDQEFELQPSPRYDVDEDFIPRANEEINDVYQIPVSEIPELRFEIANNQFAEDDRVYSKERLISRGEGQLLFPPTLHKYSDINWEVVQSLQTECYTSQYPPWYHRLTMLKKRMIEILETPGIEFRRDKGEKYASIKHIESDMTETLISQEEISQFQKNIQKSQLSNESLMQKRIRDAMNDASPSNIQKEAQRDFQDLSRQVTNATKEAEFFMSPPRSTVNMIYNDSIEERNNYFLEKGIIYRANVILRHIISLAKYTKFNINFFGLNNEKYDIALGDARDVVKRMEYQQGVDRLYSLFDLIGIARIVLPGDKVVFQKKILEPSTPSPELRTTQEQLTSAGSGQT